MNDPKTIFIETIRSNADIPVEVKGCAGDVSELHQKVLDQSYLDFLDEQIRLCPRGEEWNKVLKKRKQALTGFVGKVVMTGLVKAPGKQVNVKIDPEERRVLYWEDWTS